MTGVELIAQERQRQQTEKGYDAEHDAGHEVIDFVGAAIAYANPGEAGRHWPWNFSGFHPSKDERVNLAKAGALIAAAIDRLEAQ